MQGGIDDASKPVLTKRLTNKGEGEHMSTEAVSVNAQGWPWPAALESFTVPGWIGQQVSWVEDPVNSDSAAYNYPLLLRIRGPLNEQALRSSLDELIQRHAVLRSIFEINDSTLKQVVLGEHACPFRSVDLSAADESERDNAAREIVETEAETPFRLSIEIPFRAVLLRLESELHELLMVTHHLAYDDWSNGVLVDELSVLYAALAANQLSPLPDVPVQYGDFVRWSARRMAGQELATNIAFWKSQLGDGATFHHVRPDLIARDAGRASARADLEANLNGRIENPLKQPGRDLKRGARAKIVIPEKLTSALNQRSREQRASLFMTLTASFQSLMHRYSGDEDIAVGTCVANRPQMQLEKLIGRFGNHLVIRTSMAENPSFQEVQQRVREASLTAYGYEEMPFGEVLRAVRPDGDSRCDHVVQTMFVLQNAPKGAWEIPGLDVSWKPVKRRTTRYDLTVWLRSSKTIDITLEYNANLFQRGTIERILNGYREILEEMIERPDAPVSNRTASPTGDSVHPSADTAAP